MRNRRDFVRNALALGALQRAAGLPAGTAAMAALWNEEGAQEMNPDFDGKSYNFWCHFLDPDKVAKPIIRATGQFRGDHPTNDLQPVYLHYGPKGFRNAAELDASELIVEGDVSASLNTSIIKIAPRDQSAFDHLQNAQLRVDMAQKQAILPVIEPMAYTVVSGLLPWKVGGKPLGKPGLIQSINVESGAAWQKMQNIILPGGEGRWALNLEAQKKDSLFFKVLQNMIKETGRFTPLLGFPGIALSALQSFNILYGAIHAQPVHVIDSNPVRVFATQEAVQETGAPGAVSGILLKSGTYVLIPANQAPELDQLKDLTVTQGRIVPPRTAVSDLDAAAAETLKDVTYVTFDVEANPARLFPAREPRKSA